MAEGVRERDNGPPSVVKVLRAGDGVQLEYEILGSGPPLVMLHGTYTGRRAFSRQRPLADAFRLIMPSARAHENSGSSVPPDYGIETTELGDLRAVVDAEGLGRFSLLGHSTGGAVAFSYARQFPERVHRLVLIEPTIIDLLPPSERDRVASDWLKIISIAETQGPTAGLRNLMDFVGGNAWHALDADKRAATLEKMGHFAPHVIPNLKGGLEFRVSESDVRSISAPTMLIYGTASFDFEPSIARRFRELRPDWPLVVIEGGTHNCFREQPDGVNTAIHNFLTS